MLFLPLLAFWQITRPWPCKKSYLAWNKFNVNKRNDGQWKGKKYEKQTTTKLAV
jgi:hypothetical protein